MLLILALRAKAPAVQFELKCTVSSYKSFLLEHVADMNFSGKDIKRAMGEQPLLEHMLWEVKYRLVMETQGQ